VEKGLPGKSLSKKNDAELIKNIENKKVLSLLATSLSDFNILTTIIITARWANIMG
jgi:hypothetical protein